MAFQTAPENAAEHQERLRQNGQTYRDIVHETAATIDKEHHNPLEELHSRINGTKKQTYLRQNHGSETGFDQGAQVKTDRANSATNGDGSQELQKQRNGQVSTIRALCALHHATSIAVNARDEPGVKKMSQRMPYRETLMHSVARPSELSEVIFHQFVWQTIHIAEYRVIERQLGAKAAEDMRKTKSFDYLCGIFGRTEMNNILNAEFLRLWQREIRHLGNQNSWVPVPEFNYVQPYKLDSMAFPIFIPPEELKKRSAPDQNVSHRGKRVRVTGSHASQSGSNPLELTQTIDTSLVYDPSMAMICGNPYNSEYWKPFVRSAIPPGNSQMPTPGPSTIYGDLRTLPSSADSSSIDAPARWTLQQDPESGRYQVRVHNDRCSQVPDGNLGNQIQADKSKKLNNQQPIHRTDQRVKPMHKKIRNLRREETKSHISNQPNQRRRYLNISELI